MPFASLLGGTLMPVLLMLSPFAVMAAKHDGAHARPAAQYSPQPCTRQRLPLM
ncbi:hypothetical protein [Sphingobium sp.]|uniref:hypothetical protein n=1 Tax=Sphingobium sp. TaxID=1912891 RepID=UPI002631491E|nr:hypothetical protein [Sphingobium sp.]